jgi:hypothetical protein
MTNSSYTIYQQDIQLHLKMDIVKEDNTKYCSLGSSGSYQRYTYIFFNLLVSIVTGPELAAH